MNKIYDVAGLGSAIVDVIAPVDDAFLARHNITKGVMTLIDESRAGELLGALGPAREIAGGSAANTMAGLASLGAKGIFSGRVKNDRLGHVFADSMTGLGVRYTTQKAEGGCQTASCIIAVTPDGQRSMNTYLGACRDFGPTDINEDEIIASKILYIEGYLWDAPEAKAACKKAMAAAKRSGTKIAFTLSDPFCVGRYREEFFELLRNDLDILFANEDEAKALFQVSDFDDVFQAMRPWSGVAALTRSEKGCVVAHQAEVHVVDAVPGVQVIDTTGAGDQFAAGFLYGLTHGLGLAQCGRLGAMAAGEVIAHYGARPEVSLRELARTKGLIAQ